MNKRGGKVSGFAFGAFSGISWGVDTVLLGIVLIAVPFVIDPIRGPLLATFIHDGISFLFLFSLLLFKGKGKQFFKALTTRDGRFIALAALCGGPLGMASYLLAIKNIGSGYAAVITAMYPAIGAVLAYIFLRDRLKKLGVLGFMLAITSSILVGVLGQSVGNFSLFGFFMAMLCAFGWGAEAVICSYGMKDEVAPEIAIVIRQFTSTLVYGLLIIPISGAYKLIQLNQITLIITPIIVITAIAGSLSYLAYYSAIDSIGPTRAMGLNISYSAWAVIFGFFVGEGFSLRLFALAIMIILGSLMTAEDFMPKFKFMKAFSKR